MVSGNYTTTSGFILLGYSNLTNLQGLLFVVFLIIYMVILIGNGVIVFVTMLDSTLHTPMYFFLRNLSFVEICYTSVTLPKMVANCLAEDGKISFIGCAAQMYFSLLLGGTECFLLAAMAFDRYVAICNPLHYTLIVNSEVCASMVAGSWLVNILAHFGQTYLVFSLPFCESREINHFFCDIPPLLELSCVDTFRNKIAVFIAVLLFIITPFFFIVISYIKIASTIMKMPSAQGRCKAFSTCSSHLTVVTLFYGSVMIAYLKPKSKGSVDTDKLLSLFYTIMTPVFNPFIYSLRNKEVKIALRKILSGK
ncbi:olfactory receptor 10AG1-like [Malaclemys terrapin pileata]|uniref:olfactory receptor 10AG1-like n=1 Tax=Malaclemys terrapin pileata TaxID=2991368 RepID=UPI0023A8C242|nr:olfactory receptor 10AG1-like [Malaclemys terrapin pileata]